MTLLPIRADNSTAMLDMSSSPTQDDIAAAIAKSSASAGVDFEFSFAFQPIVDVDSGLPVSFEALLRGPHGESPSQVFARVPRSCLHRFDQACRLKAIHLAKSLNLTTRLHLNLLPNSSRYVEGDIRAAVQASRQTGFQAENLVFEVNEAEPLRHYTRVGLIFRSYRGSGVRTAIDDFGAGRAGLRMLAEYQPDYIKLDRHLVAGIHADRVKQILVKGMARICRQLGIQPIAEGVEQAAEYHWLRNSGIQLFQGFYFARPAFEALAEVRPNLF